VLDPLEHAGSPIHTVSRRIHEAVPTPVRPAMVPTDPRSSTTIPTRSLATGTEAPSFAEFVGRTSTAKSMVKQAAAMGIDVPSDVRKISKEFIASYIDEQLSK
jgi:hypothetical protein